MKLMRTALFLLVLSISACVGFNLMNSRGNLNHVGSRLQQALHMGYVPPEKDPEYRPMVKKSLLKPLEGEGRDLINLEVKLPVPKEGDIVGAPGKWEGETQLCKIKYLQYSQVGKVWNADVVPLIEGKSDSVWVVDTERKSFLEKVENLRPVQSFFMRSENGYRISFRANSTSSTTSTRSGSSLDTLAPVYKAEAYRPLEPSYKVPRNEVDMGVVSRDMALYEELKKRIILNSLRFGAVGAVAVQFWLGFDAAVSYTLGASSGALYLFLLGKQTDQIGASFSATLDDNTSSSSGGGGGGGDVNSDSAPGGSTAGADAMAIAIANAKKQKIDESLGKARFAAPVLLMALLTAKNVAAGGDIAPFALVPRSDFLPALGGFLTYRVSLFFTEVATELTEEDMLGFLPGSMAEAMRLDKKLKQQQQQLASDGGERVLSRVVFITGPRAAGRLKLAPGLVGKVDGMGMPVRRVRLLTSDNLAAQRRPDRYTYVSSADLDAQRADGLLAWEGSDKLELGGEVRAALDTNTLMAANGEVIVVDGEPSILDALRTMPALRLSPVWVSLQTKEQFIEKASAIVQEQVATTVASGGGGTGTRAVQAALAAEQVSDLVNEAAKDITYYMQKAPLFEYTLLNLGSDAETLLELEAIAKNQIN